MMRLTVELAENSYDIIIAHGILSSAGEKIAPYLKDGGKLVVITDENVYSLYRYAVDNLQNAFPGSPVIPLPPGETSKSQKNLGYLYSRFNEAGLMRNGLVVALGGGVIGDIAGYAAASWMRGTPYIQMPTTLLAQVDSSVGGKTAVNLPEGKNLIGAFYQPKTVLIDPDTLKTLPKRELASGYAEVIKYGAIRSAQLFGKLEQENGAAANDRIEIGGVICECCGIKAGIVARDEKDLGERMLLNFGHTFGHAIEKYYDYKRYNHGEAVALGMVIAAKIGEELGVTEHGTSGKISAILGGYGLACDPPCAISELLPLVKTDKKGNGDNLNLVLLTKIGEAMIKRTSHGDLSEAALSAEVKWKI